jgi:hypothetical protein
MSFGVLRYEIMGLIEMARDLGILRYEIVGVIELALDHIQLQTFINFVMNNGSPTERDLLTSPEIEKSSGSYCFLLPVPN